MTTEKMTVRTSTFFKNLIMMSVTLSAHFSWHFFLPPGLDSPASSFSSQSSFSEIFLFEKWFVFASHSRLPGMSRLLVGLET